MKTFSYSTCLFGLMCISTSYAIADESSPVILDSDPGLLQRKSIIIIKKRSEQKVQKGITLGSYTFLPDIMITEYHDDNVYATESSTKDDFVTVFTPTFSIKSNWKKHALNMDGGVEVARYSALTTENTEDIWLNVNGKYDLTKNQIIRAGYSYSREHEDRGSADAAIGNTPVKFDDISAHVGYLINSKNNHFKIIYNSKKLNFYSVDSSGGPIQNDDRDRHEYGIGLRYLLKYSANIAFYMDGVADNRDYVLTTDYEGNNRNSKGYRYSLGVEHITPTTFSRFYVGQLSRDYDSPIFNSINEPDVGLKFNWKFTTNSNLSIVTKRSIEETTVNNSPGYLMDDYSLILSVDVTDVNNVNFNATNANTKYYLVNREDNYINYSIGYSQKLQDNLTFSFDLHRATRDSNVSGETYKINQVFLRIKAAI